MPIPSPTSITCDQFKHLVSCYRPVVQAVYRSRIKDAIKLAQAFEDDDWRNEGLTTILASRCNDDLSGMWLKKEELERLVRWKITHGTNRPFLPAMIRKNDASLVKSATSSAFDAHFISKGHTFPTEALKTLTTLNGVGPATATLVLSIADPTNVPFFQDELYYWLCNGGETAKLKYNMKEYQSLFEEVEKLRKRLGGTSVERVSAGAVEKVGFVVGHLDVLSKDERKKLDELSASTKDEEDGPNEEDAVSEVNGEEEEALKETGKQLESGPDDKKAKTGLIATGKRKSRGAETALPSRKSKRTM